ILQPLTSSCASALAHRALHSFPTRRSSDLSSRVLEAINVIKSKLPEVELIAGNVATFDGACELARAGVDGIKVGIGPGSICTTRVVTGAGVPQITAIAETYRATKDAHIPVIADGGIK